jgi:hypothetical protein
MARVQIVGESCRTGKVAGFSSWHGLMFVSAVGQNCSESLGLTCRFRSAWYSVQRVWCMCEVATCLVMYEVATCLVIYEVATCLVMYEGPTTSSISQLLNSRAVLLKGVSTLCRSASPDQGWTKRPP